MKTYNECIFQSETYSLWDTLFYCKGTIGNVNPNWGIDNGLTSTPDSEGNLLENSTSSGKAYTSNVPPSKTILDYNTPFCVEFDCISITGARIYINTSTGGSNIDRNFTNYITGNNNVKMLVYEDKYDLIVDGVTKLSNQAHSLVNPVGVMLVVYGTCNLKYKEFKVYPFK